MEKAKDFEDSPKGLTDPIQCDCGKWMEKTDSHEMGEKSLCRACNDEFQEMLDRSKNIKLPKDVVIPQAIKRSHR